MSGNLTRMRPQTISIPAATTPGSPFPGYPNSVATDAQLTINYIDVTPVAEWDATWEERADGSPGQMTVTLQDRGNINTYGARERITLKILGAIAFDGEIVSAQLDLPPGVPWRRWKITATDWNTVLDLRLVNVPAGYMWTSVDGGKTFLNVDPNAQVAGNDKLTVRDFMAYYATQPDGTPFNANTFVFSYIPNGIIYNSLGQPNWEPNLRETLKSAFDGLRGLASIPIYFWIDPDSRLHWVALPDLATPTNNPPAPAAITDVSPDGTTTVGGRGLTIHYDGTYMPQAIHITGVTDFDYNNGAGYLVNGTGWANEVSGQSLRQISVDAQATSKAQRDSVGGAYAAYGQRARVRGSVTVGKPLTSSVIEKVDGWRCGQMLQITDARLPPGISGKLWPILAVRGKLWSTINVREYTLEFGDAPSQHFSAKYRTSPAAIQSPRQPSHTHQIFFPNSNPLPSSSQVLVSQMVDASKKPVRGKGVPVFWKVMATDSAGVVVPGQGSVSAIVASTDANGQTTATFTTGATAGLDYTVTATTP